MKKFTPYLFALIILAVFGFGSNSSKKSSDDLISARVDSVLSLMTLEDKIGQLNQLSFGIGWGPAVKISVPDEYKELIRQGKVGSFLNAVGAEFTYELQKIAVNES